MINVHGGSAQPVFVVNPANPANGGGGPVEVTSGNIVAEQGTPGAEPWLVAGNDGALALNATAQAIVDAILDRLPASVGGRLPVGVEFPETQPVSADALPLPAGAATNATVQAVVDAILARLPEAISGRLPVNVTFPATQAISAASLPLPAGAATQTTLAAVLAALGGTLSVSGPLTDAQLRATPILIMDPIAYYASAAGGRVAYNITTGVVTIGSSGEQPLAALVNPSDSGKDLVLDLGEFGASAATTFRRYRNATITPTGSPLTGSNIGGGGTTTVARMYVGGTSPTYTRSGGTVSKDAFIAASTTYFTRLAGRSILRPGQSLAWTIQGPQSGNFTASVYFEFYERNAEA